MDTVSEERLNAVHPLLAAKVRAMDSILAAEGITIRVTQGYRSWDEQAALYAKGRSEPGSIVTNAPAGSSYHNFGLAVDVVPMTDTGPDWDVSHPVWRRIVEVGKSVGLDAGAMWRTFKDYPHFQLVGNLSASPSPQTRALLAKGGVKAVWQATGLGPTDEEKPA